MDREIVSSDAVDLHNLLSIDKVSFRMVSIGDAFLKLTRSTSSSLACDAHLRCGCDKHVIDLERIEWICEVTDKSRFDDIWTSSV